MVPHNIESYRFGRIRIDGKDYSNDVIIMPEGVIPEWWREKGHSLSERDLDRVLENPPEVLVIGRGASGMMKTPEETLESLRGRGIEVITCDSAEAAKRYNEESARGRRAAAAIHLTC